MVPYGPWLLLPFGVLAALLPYAKARNFGLAATFLTPLVVLLIDLLDVGGWQLAEARLVDTVLAARVVLRRRVRAVAVRAGRRTCPGSSPRRCGRSARTWTRRW